MIRLDPAKCGSEGNYRAHLRRKEPACAPCLEANARGRRGRAARLYCTHSSGCTKRRTDKFLRAKHFRVVYGKSISAYRGRYCTHASGCSLRNYREETS